MQVTHTVRHKGVKFARRRPFTRHLAFIAFSPCVRKIDIMRPLAPFGMTPPRKLAFWDVVMFLFTFKEVIIGFKGKKGIYPVINSSLIINQPYAGPWTQAPPISRWDIRFSTFHIFAIRISYLVEAIDPLGWLMAYITIYPQIICLPIRIFQSGY